MLVELKAIRKDIAPTTTSAMTNMPVISLNSSLMLSEKSETGVTSVKPVSDFSDNIKELFKLITGMLVIAEVVVGAMSFLIAFNSTSISVDERAREIATMFAYGLPVRTVTRMQMLEN